MLIYILIEIVLILFLFGRRNGRMKYGIASFFLLVIAIFRAKTVGADTANYFLEYQGHGECSWNEILRNSEYSFAVFCKLLNIIGLNERGFLVVTSILFSTLLIIAFKVNHCDKILTLSLYYMTGFYIQSFCIIRQSLAVAVALIAYANLEKHFCFPSLTRLVGSKYYFRSVPIGYIVGMIIAIGFHPTVIVLGALPIMMLYFDYRKATSPAFFLKYGIAGMMTILLLFSRVYPLILRHSMEKYQDLYGGNYVMGIFENYKSGFLLVVLYMFFYLAYWNNWKKLSKKENVLVGSVLTLSIAFSALSIISSTLGRINLFWEGMMILMLDKLLRKSYRKSTSINCYVILFFAIYFILYLMRDSIAVVPYQFWK